VITADCRLLVRLASGLVLATLCGCAHHTPRPDENFAATLPEEEPLRASGSGAIYQDGHEVGLFDNAVARRVGDVLTIELVENTAATKSATTTTKKTTTMSTAPVLAGGILTVHGKNVLNNSLNDASTFDGEGGSTQSNQLTGYISVTVAKRLANGNLLVRGARWVTLNQGREYIRIQGIVRPIDISPENTVASTQVADATIAYGEEGVLNDANTKSWVARFFDSKWWPF
jgi:flagellar L-ring protein precursor FlgH